MHLFRIPCLLATAIAVDKAFTSPTSDSKSSERVPITSKAERLIWALEIPYAGGRELAKVGVAVIASQTASDQVAFKTASSLVGCRNRHLCHAFR
jgi:hypothetical protein